MKINKWLLVATLALSSIGLVSCQQKKVRDAEVVSSASVKTPREIIKSPVKKTDFLLGTAVALSVYHPNTEDLLTRAFALVKDLEARITVNASGSEVDAINEAAGDHAVAVSDEVYDVIKQGIAYSEEFNGSFDITVGPLTSLWRIGFPDARKPSQKEIDDALPLVNYKNVVLNDEERSVFLTQKGMLLDLGGIAKGFIADQLWNFFKNGKTYHHILNPKTGYPYENDIAGVSIIVSSSTRGDALSTSMFSIGVEEGLKYVNQKDDVDAVFMTKDKKVYVSNSIKDTFKLTNQRYTWEGSR